MDYKSALGYSKGSPYANNPFLDIFSQDGIIDMSNTPIDLLGIDNKGNKKIMKAGRKNPYKFEGTTVREIPIMKKGGNPFQKGGMNALFSYLFEEDKEEDDKSSNNVTAPSTDDIEERESNLTKREQEVADQEEYYQALALANYEDNPFAERPVTAFTATKSSGSSSGFRTYNTPEEGWNALINQLNLYRTGKTKNPVGPNSTLLQAMSVYAPFGDGANNPIVYAQTIAKRLGISPNTPISQIDVNAWAKEVAKIEGNKTGNNPGNIRR